MLRPLRVLAAPLNERLGMRIHTLPPLGQRFLPYLPAQPVIVEAGGHWGTDTRWLATLAAGGAVHTFEPVPAVFARLTQATRRCRNVHRYPLALSDSDGTATIFLSAGSSDASSSLLEPKPDFAEHWAGVRFGDRVVVETVRLESWAARYHIPRVDFLWLDLQGHELAALRGGEALLPQVHAIWTEVALAENYAGSALYPELRRWLEERGFSVAFEALDEREGNVLFVRS